MERLAVDEKSGAPLRFARRPRRPAAASRRRSCSAEGSRASSAAVPPGAARGSRAAAAAAAATQRGLLRLHCGGCGRRSCAACPARIVRTDESPLCLHCQEENSAPPVDEETLLPAEKALSDAAVKEDISALTAQCGVVGSNWTGAVEVQEDHQQAGEQAAAPCHFKHGQVVTQEKLPDHLWSSCPKSNLRPSRSQTDVSSDHLNLTVVSFSRQDRCRFSRIGCSFQGEAKEGELHEADALEAHLRLLLQHVKQLKACLGLSGEGERKRWPSDGEISTRFPFNPAPQGCPEGEFLSGMPLHEEGLPWQSLVRRDQGVSSLETKLRIFENIVSVLAKEMAASRQRFVALRGQRGLDQDMIRGLELKIADLQRCLVQKDTALSKLEERFQAAGQASYDGVFLWKIADVHRKSYEAVCGKISSFLSPAFYTSRFGYKLCMRVYLNGEGSSKGSYLSLFLVLLKGDYDTLLAWPFAHKVTLTLLDQDDGEHFANTIHPDPASPSFRRPVAGASEAAGFPRFIPLAKLQSPKYAYIKEGTLFLRCVVHGGP